jgi:hypothetical protein
VATPPPPARLYRIIRTQHPSWSDFLSNQVRDQPRRDVELREPLEWTGPSTFDTEQGARAAAQRFPALGRYIAELAIPDGTSALIYRSGGPGHWTVVGGPGVLLGYVVAPILRV